MTDNAISCTLLSTSNVQKIAPVSNVTLWRWVRDGKFPAPIQVAKNNSWRSGEVGAWMDECPPDAPRPLAGTQLKHVAQKRQRFLRRRHAENKDLKRGKRI